MRIFQFDTELYINRFLAVCLRKPRWKSWLYVLLLPLKELKNEFDDDTDYGFVGRINYRLSFSSQTLILQYLLRKEFACDDIVVSNNSNASESVFLGYDNESGAIHYVGYYPEVGVAVSLGYYSEMSTTGVDFIVTLPSASPGFSVSPTAAQADKDKVARMAAIIDKYKLSSRRFSIVNS
jgi:hypothetical protein